MRMLRTVAAQAVAESTLGRTGATGATETLAKTLLKILDQSHALTSTVTKSVTPPIRVLT